MRSARLDRRTGRTGPPAVWGILAGLLAVAVVIGVVSARRQRSAADDGPAPAAPPDDDATPPSGLPVVTLDAQLTDPGLRLPVPTGVGVRAAPPAPAAAAPYAFTPQAAPHPSGPPAALPPTGAPAALRPADPSAVALHGTGSGGAPAGLLTAPPPAPPAPAAPPRHRWGLGAYVVAELVFVGVSALLAVLLLGGEGTPSAGTLVALVAVPTLAAAGTAVLITYWRGNGPRLDLGLRWRSRDLALGLAFGFGGLFVTIPAAAIYVSLMGDDVSSAVGVLFGDVRATPLTAVLVFLVVAFVAPMCEEILYRGLLWGGITRLGAGPWVTFAVTTVIFALAHFEFERAPLLLVVAIPIGLARVYTGGLLAPIVAHQVNNLLPGIGLMLLLLGVLPEV